MELYPYFVIFLLFVSQDVSSKKHSRHKKDKHDKIVGGEEANVPYQVYLLLYDGQDNYQCGGSLMSSRYILTAAHCLTDIKSIKIRIGSSISNEGGKEYEASAFESHPKYDPKHNDYDTGIVEVGEDMDIDGSTSAIVKIADSGTTPDDGTELYISGWGLTSEDGQVSTNLMAVEVPKTSQEYCESVYNSITSRMFCAGEPEGGKDSCQGDSGGPAVDESSGVQVGVVSFGLGCARPGVPGVYANIGDPEIRDWISQTTGL